MKIEIKLIPLLLLLVSTEISAKPLIMLTAFEPFGGKTVNNSYNIAKEIKSRISNDFDVEICVLPVVFDKGAAKAKSCYEKMSRKPETVISLGESDCNIRLETAAHNLDDADNFPDNDGNVRTNHIITPGGVPSIGFNLPVQRMYCSVPASQKGRITVSETPGGFVCNNTSYQMANYFQGKPVQYGFIHIPPVRCMNSDPAKNGEIIGNMIRSVNQYNTTVAVEANTPFPHCSNDNRMPLSRNEIDLFTSLINKVTITDCEKEFLARLRARL